MDNLDFLNFSDDEPIDFSLSDDIQNNIQNAVRNFQDDDILNRIFASRKKVATMLDKANVIISQAEKDNIITRIAQKFGEYKTKPNKLAYACGTPIYVVTDIFLFSNISYDVFHKITDNTIENIADKYITNLMGKQLDTAEQLVLLEEVIQNTFS